MPNEPQALARLPPDAIKEDDYQAFCAALSASARGRAFLADYAKRNRNADTEVLLAALDRLETRLRADASAVERMRDDLRMLLIAIRLARPDIDSAGVTAKTTQLAALLNLLERRIEAMTEPARTQAAPADEPDAPATAQGPGDAARSHLAVVPLAEEPELPIPSPAGAQLPTVTLVHPIVALPEVTLFEPPQPKSVVVEEKAVASAPVESAVVEQIVPAPIQDIEAAPPAAKPARPPASPLALLMTLSEDERIALFT